MKKIILATALALTLFTPAAFAASPYLSLGGGMNYLADSDVDAGLGDLTVSYNTGYTVRGAVGVKFDRNQNLRAEIEGFYSDNESDDLNVWNVAEVGVSENLTLSGFLVNGYYDFNFNSPFIPYVTAGVGWAYAEMGDDDTSGVAYAMGAGVAYELNKNISLDLGYRYFGTEDLAFSGVDVEYGAHQVLVGARYTF